MKTEPNKHALRAAHTRTKVMTAAIGMIAERGLPGFAISNIAPAAGVSRGLANYHFVDRAALIEAVFVQLLDDEPTLEGLGLSPLLAWVGDQARRAAQREPKLLALLQLAVGPGVETEAPALRQEYWRRRGDLVERHLLAARALGQIRDDLAPAHLAMVFLGLMHGELLRIAATGEGPSGAFPILVERALVPERVPTAKSPRSASAQSGGGKQGNLFD